MSVENVADRAGSEVVQLYARHRGGRTVRPERELVGFERLDIDAGARATVDFEMPSAALAVHDREGRLVVEPGTVDLIVGRSAADTRGRASVDLRGEPARPDRRPHRAESTVRRG
ncbi:fibronectin type III-like domain-contianing protein [Halomicroarcula sp. GCM10025709]|uniref:fibronectin type III-like domain-contianing protein n=1 Tax=Halomicroarcula sp. GCM10025709 TaxID=3252669 RepID=UPI00360A8A19